MELDLGIFHDSCGDQRKGSDFDGQCCEFTTTINLTTLHWSWMMLRSLGRRRLCWRKYVWKDTRDLLLHEQSGLYFRIDHDGRNHRHIVPWCVQPLTLIDWIGFEEIQRVSAIGEQTRFMGHKMPCQFFPFPTTISFGHSGEQEVCMNLWNVLWLNPRMD